MNRGALVRLAFILLAALPAAAQNSLEIIDLRHRTAEQVMPVLKPLVEPGGTLSGQGTQLFVRASPANLAELRRALESIDRPAKRLQISVRFDDASSRSRSGFDVREGVQDSTRSHEERVDQRIRVLDGGRAMIFTGPQQSVSQRQMIQTPAGVVSQPVTVVQDRTSGFEVVPRVAGNTVQVEILTQRKGTSGASAPASGALGRWFELGSVEMSNSRDQRNITGARSSQTSETRRVWVKVDELP
jgi:hypothetical protein